MKPRARPSTAQGKAGIALAFLAVPAAIVSAAAILLVAGYSYQTASGEAGTSGQPGTTVTSSGRVTTLAVAGMMSIGIAIAPVAVLLLLSATLLTLDRKGPRNAQA